MGGGTTRITTKTKTKTTTKTKTKTKTKTPSSTGSHAVSPATPNSQCPSYQAEDEPAKYPPGEPNGGTHQEWVKREWRMSTLS